MPTASAKRKAPPAKRKPPEVETREKAVRELVERVVVPGGYEVLAANILMDSPACASTTYRYLRKFMEEGWLIRGEKGYYRRAP